MPGLFRALRDEVRRWRHERSGSCPRHATRRRVREQLGVEDLEQRIVVLAQQLSDERNFVRGQLERGHEQLEHLGTKVGHANAVLVEHVTGIMATQRHLDERLATIEHRQQVWSVMEYLQTADVEEKTLVSVIMATRIAPTTTCRAPSPR